MTPQDAGAREESRQGRRWLRHGLLNTLEQGLTRFGDAVTTFVLIWTLPADQFSKLALAQAWITPSLFLFLCPEMVIYRDLAGWKKLGARSVAARIGALRHFCWAKGLAALAGTALIFGLAPRAGKEWFWALLWAYFVGVGVQLSGADREFLRLELRLARLNVLGLLQKSVLLGGTLVVAFGAGGRIDLLAAVAILAAIGTALLARCWAVAELGATVPDETAGEGRLPSAFATIREAIFSFSLWQHISLITLNWVRTMDLFFLGILRVPPRTLGLYAASVKIANLVTAVPFALANLFAVWVGQHDPGAAEAEERTNLRRGTVRLALGTLCSAVLLRLASPAVVGMLSHGRWEAGEVALMLTWLDWLILGGAVFSVGLLATSWLGLRSPVRGLFLSVHLPWTAAAIVLFAAAANAGPMLAARTGVVVGGLYVVLVWLRFRRITVPRPRGAAP